MTIRSLLQMWTLYDRPRDYPNHFVARLSLIGDGGAVMTRQVLLGDTLDEVRAQLPPGLYCQPRHPSDDPVIIETWF